MTVTRPEPAYLPQNLSELWLIVPGFDDLLLTGETTDDDGNTFTILAQAAEATFGNPIPIDVAVQRWMTDGAVASTQGHENREISFKVIVSAKSAAQLTAGESALSLRANGPVLLKWVPPSGPDDTVPTVFEVWTWHLTQEFDIDREMRLACMYGVAATAKPWARSAELTVVDAVTTSATPTVVQIDDCTSLTGWTGSPNAPTLLAGGVRELSNATPPTSASLTRTGAISGLGATPYLALDMFVGGYLPLVTITANLDGVPLAFAGQSGSVRYFALPTGVTSFATLVVTGSYGAHGGQPDIRVNNVSTTDTIGGLGSAMQLIRSLEVGGSVPTSGSVQVASPNATPLGTVMVYTTHDDGSGYSPPLRQYRTSGPTGSTDTAAVSGIKDPLVISGNPQGTVTFTILAALIAEGTYAVVGRFFSLFAPATLTAAITAAVGGGATDNIVGKVSWTTTGWKWAVLGALALPTQPIPQGSGLNVVITLTGTAPAPGTISLDELYLLNLTTGEITLVNAGATATRLWLDAADADPVRNRPQIYAGTLDDRSDAVGVPSSQIMSFGDHDLDPRGVTLFTVTDGVPGAEVSGSFYQRWHSRAGA